jgi:hypothetical protein
MAALQGRILDLHSELTTLLAPAGDATCLPSLEGDVTAHGHLGVVAAPRAVEAPPATANELGRVRSEPSLPLEDSLYPSAVNALGAGTAAIVPRDPQDFDQPSGQSGHSNGAERHAVADTFAGLSDGEPALAAEVAPLPREEACSHVPAESVESPQEKELPAAAPSVRAGAGADSIVSEQLAANEGQRIRLLDHLDGDGSEPLPVADGSRRDTPTLADVPADRTEGAPRLKRAKAIEPDSCLSDPSGRELQEAAEHSREPGAHGQMSWENQTPQQAAVLLRTRDEPSDWVNFFWSLIRADELPTAYWLARSLSDTIESAILPAPLLAAAYGARCLADDQDLLVLDLLAVVQEFSIASTGEQELVQLAAALVPSLIAPATGMSAWLTSPAACPALHPLVEKIREFAGRGIALHPADLEGIAGQEQREARILAGVQEAEHWLSAAKHRQPHAVACVRAYLVHYDLSQLLTPVIQDRRREVDTVRREASQWQRHRVLQRIRTANQELKRAKAWEIHAGTQDLVLHDVEEAVSRALQWCRLVERERLIAAQGSWVVDQIAELRSEIQQALPVAEASLARLTEATEQLAMGAAALCLRRGLAQLRRTLHLPPGDGVPALAHERDIPAAAPQRLERLLNLQLLWLPGSDLDDAGWPLPQALPEVAAAIRDAFADQRSLREVSELWLEQRDCRFIDEKTALCKDPDLVAELGDHAQEKLEGLRDALRTDISETQAQIEQGVVDGIIAEERSEYVARVEEIEPDEVRNFAPSFSILQQVREELAQARQKRMAEVQQSWQSLEPELLGSHVDATSQERIQSFIGAALAREDTRVVDECLARLRETLDTGTELDENWFSPPPVRDALHEYMEIRPRLEEKLNPKPNRLTVVMTDIQKGHNRWGLQYAQLSAPRRQEAFDALKAWEEMRRLGSSAAGHQHRIGLLLRFLGFTLSCDGDAAVTFEQSKEDWLYARSCMSASGLAKPIPQFGSMARNRYEALCLWERPAADVIGARLHDLRLDMRSLIVFYLGRLSDRQRYELTRLSRERELAITLLDETLLLFLTAESDARLPVFLRCSLPFAAVNPYTPFQAGDVPPEMFFGREVMARELLRPEGSCLVYGGRQLGKSALLRHVQRQFENPERDQYAWVEDIKLIGDAQAAQPTSTLWRRLREGFIRAGLLKRATGESADVVTRQIRDVMDQSPDRRVLVMFDEADNFLLADAQDGFQVVTALRELMLHTQRRFKVIFAGLHHVQQFQGIPNQPLAHFGRPILVGPLEPDAAQRLVREPFEALGYRFEEAEAGVLRILSYTNYHPGLVQLFCQELLKRLHSRLGREHPPYRIQQSDIEAVYLQVRKDIRDRFDWTLALDPRYQAIAWAMVESQLTARDSFARTYAPNGLLDLVRGWWPQGFLRVETDQFHALLDEMCGLGVLVRNVEGHYRLRSPNLVRLMGAQNDIETRLLELSEKPPEVRFDIDSHHASLDDVRQHYSPLTHLQERELNRPHFGVGLVFASEALGYSQLSAAVRRFIPSDLPDNLQADCAEIPSAVRSAEKMREWLGSYYQQHSRHERLVVYQLVTDASPDLETRVRAALRFCQERLQRRKQWLRVLFLFNSSATWAWHSLPLETRRKLEDQTDFATHPRRWNLASMRQRLAQHRHDKMSSDEVCQHVLQVTGGWPWLLDQMFDRCENQNDPRPAANLLESELNVPGSSLLRKFEQCLGIERGSVPWRVMEHVQSEGPVPRELLIPEAFDSDSVPGAEDCTAAVEFLHWLGCLEWHEDCAQLAPLVDRILTVQ